MPIAARLKWFLDVHRVHYDVVKAAAGKRPVCPDDQRVVSHLFHDAKGYVLVVHPASREIAMPALREFAGRPLHPARASELRDIFFDCQKGVVPPVGPAYGIPTVVDDSLPRDGDLYFRAGEGEDWVHMSGAEFQGLVADAPHGDVSIRA
jgi:Ala-tRNA(Pro) deacylase